MSNEEKRKALLEMLDDAQGAMISAELELADFVEHADDDDIVGMLDTLKGYRFLIREVFITRVRAGDYDEETN